MYMLPLYVTSVLVSNLCRFCHWIFSILPKIYFFILLLREGDAVFSIVVLYLESATISSSRRAVLKTNVITKLF